MPADSSTDTSAVNKPHVNPPKEFHKVAILESEREDRFSVLAYILIEHNTSCMYAIYFLRI